MRIDCRNFFRQCCLLFPTLFAPKLIFERLKKNRQKKLYSVFLKIFFVLDISCKGFWLSVNHSYYVFLQSSTNRLIVPEVGADFQKSKISEVFSEFSSLCLRFGHNSAIGRTSIFCKIYCNSISTQ